MKSMKGFIFAAGLGTRLQPLTDHKPKALVELNGQPLLYHAIQKLKEVAVDEIIINVHHFSTLVIDYVQQNDFGISITISDESDFLLDTGGGLLKAKALLLNTPFIAYNVDIVSSINLNQLVDFHTESGNLATLVVRNRETSRYLMFDQQIHLSGWINKTSSDKIVANENFDQSQPLAFSGIQIIEPSIFDKITETGKFSVIPMYVRLAETEKIGGFLDHSDFWLDVGKPGQLEVAEEYLKSK